MLEAEDQVGGLAKTVERDGYRFDLGGHRFFTKSLEVDALWHEVLGDEFLLRPRMSRIYWNERFLDYPLRGPDVIRKLGPVELARCLALVPARRGAPKGKEDDRSRTGSRTASAGASSSSSSRRYTEKVWGVPTVRDPRRVGRAADQGPLVLRRRARPRSSATAATRSRA